jgi:DNA-binding response OmpR family regulator
MDGSELYDKLRKIDNNINVCFLTAAQQYYDKYKERYSWVQKECFITKPIRLEDLANTINSIDQPCSPKRPTVGYLTKPINFTVAVIAPMTISEQFKDFWGTYGQFIGLFAGGFVGAYAKVLFDKRKKRHEESE